MIDTKFFDERFTDRLLGTIQDLDVATGGLLINSENFQALNLLQERYRESVKCVYIDPPYNTGNDGFLYKDRYQHSSWLSMIGDKYDRSRPLLCDDSVIFTSIDDNEISSIRQIQDDIFGISNFITTCVWQKNYAPKSSARHFSVDHDYLTVYSKNAEKWIPSLLPRTKEQDSLYKKPDNDPRGPWMSNNLSARNLQ